MSKKKSKKINTDKKEKKRSHKIFDEWRLPGF